ncbi:MULTISPECIES: hypothetical protein [Paenibacillus]|uniref:Uncharacterized protein n=1 Tax=Paenibacillus illinoisensis TaxID=59845 RepID=A0A2W0C2Z7_9BACL|nr:MULTISPECIES: hypothetical protein [Paenibacillus]MBM6384038.1 hypothetical protein [Paenibacillus sp.]PAD32264.1 hypothetical protein CHH60_04600 [Paenibacillus sp. 7523-1]PYY26164.1 Uncharacterized protein PIL02S_05549 [Paenibacillus illinoisensis]
MVKTLDARTSQGSKGQGVLTPSFTNGVPLLFAQVGLQVSNPGPIIRTLFSGIVTVTANQLFNNGSLAIEVYRGLGASQQLVYRAERTVLGNPFFSPCVLSFTGSDYNVAPPANGQLVYSAYATFSYGPDTGVSNVRLGPESFNATVYSDD